MFNKVIALSAKHASLAVMALGSLSVFVANLGFKDIMTIDGYYEYSIIITVLTLLTSFGVFGIEQVFLRLSEIGINNSVLFDVKIIKIAVTAALVNSLFSAIYFVFFLVLKIDFFVIFFLSLGIIFLMLLYNVFRILSDFFYSQTILNSWKLILGFCAIYFYLFGVTINYLLILLISVWTFIIFSVFFLVKRKKIKLNNSLSYKEILLYSFQFSLALLTLSFLAQGDRFYVEYLFSKKEFGDYFYLGTFFLFPFSLLQSYVGFKELVHIKNRNINIKNKLISIIKGSLLLTFVIVFLAYTLVELNILKIDLKQNLILILIFLFIGNIKMIYSLFSAIIGVKASMSDIRKMNIIFIIISMLSIALFTFLNKTLFTTIGFFAFLWLIRVLIWGVYSKKIYLK